MGRAWSRGWCFPLFALACGDAARPGDANAKPYASVESAVVELETRIAGLPPPKAPPPAATAQLACDRKQIAGDPQPEIDPDAETVCRHMAVVSGQAHSPNFQRDMDKCLEVFGGPIGEELTPAFPCILAAQSERSMQDCFSNLGSTGPQKEMSAEDRWLDCADMVSMVKRDLSEEASTALHACVQAAHDGPSVDACLGRARRNKEMAANPERAKQMAAEAPETLQRIWSSIGAHGCPDLGSGSTGMTPPLEVLCSVGRDGFCRPEKSPTQPGGYAVDLWTANDAWEHWGVIALEPHAYHFEVEWQYDGTECAVTARARGDLDGDGVYGEYTRSGRWTPQGMTGGELREERGQE